MSDELNPPQTPVPPLIELVKLLARHGVHYLVIGGQAEALMGSPRVTFDTDICYQRTRENIERLCAALKVIGVTLRGAPADLPFRPDAQTLEAGMNVPFSSRLGDVDFLGFVEPVGDFDTLIPKAETYQPGELRVQTISLEDLIRVKQHIKRFKDSESLYQLLAIKRVREEQSRSGGA